MIGKRINVWDTNEKPQDFKSFCENLLWIVPIFIDFEKVVLFTNYIFEVWPDLPDYLDLGMSYVQDSMTPYPKVWKGLF